MVQALRTSLRYGGLRQGGLQPGLGGDSIFATSSLDLNFAKHKNLGTIVDATTGANLVDFTRASSGTYVDSEGVIRTATTNLLLQSNQFDTTWLTQNSSATSAAGTAPDGTNTAWEIKDTLDVSNVIHSIYQNFTSVTGTTYTFSVWAKAGTLPGIVLSLPATVFGVNLNVRFDLQIGTIISASAGTTNSIVAYSDGWYRLAVTATATSSASGQWQFRTDNGSTGVYQGDGTGTILIYGAQLEQSTTVGEYIPTTSTINSAPRFDHDPTTGESLGLLVEESRTNSITNNMMVGAVAGTPGTNPTGWFLTGSANGISPKIVGTGVEDGITYVDIRYSGTSTNSGNFSILTSTVTAITAATGQSWTGSAYVKLQAGSLSNLTNTLQSVNGRSSVGAGLESTNSIYTPTSDSLGVQRRTVSITLANASTARISHTIFNAAYASGATIDITLRIGLPQLEQGAFATSVIPTSGTTATRAADVASISGSNFGVSRTNLLLRSEEFETGWNLTNILAFGSGSTVNAIASPNGSVTADKVTEDTATGFHRIGQQFSHIAGVTYTFTVFVKAAERTKIHLQLSANLFKIALFDLATGTTASPDATIINYGNDWYRCSLTSTATTTTSATALVEIADDSGNRQYAGDGTSGLYLWGAQLETGSTATAYIPTTTSAVTVVESPWYRQDEGTVFAECAVAQPASGGNQFCFRSSDSSYNNSVALNVQSFGFASLSTAAGGVFNGIASSSTPLSANTTAKFAGAYTANNLGLSLNGATAVTDATATMPTAQTRADIGSDHAGVNRVKAGTIRRLTYWPTRLGNEVLQTITQ